MFFDLLPDLTTLPLKGGPFLGLSLLEGLKVSSDAPVFCNRMDDALVVGF